MVGIVIVSHSAKLAEGIRDLAIEMSADKELIVAAGGLENGEIGTDAMRIVSAIQEASKGDGVAVLVDLGSAIMSTEAAIEILADMDLDIEVKIADAPVVEGSILAAVEASSGSVLEAVVNAAEEAKNIKKLEM